MPTKSKTKKPSKSAPVDTSDAQDWIYISDLCGINPKIKFSKVEKGFAKFFKESCRQTKARHGTCNVDHKLSPLYQSLPCIERYVCHNEYQLSKSEIKNGFIVEDKENCFDLLPLWDQVSDLYYFADDMFHHILHRGGTPTPSERYFLLFANGAYLRARMDFKLFGQHTKAEMSQQEEIYFTEGDIAILSSTKNKTIEDHIRSMKPTEYTEEIVSKYINKPKARNAKTIAELNMENELNFQKKYVKHKLEGGRHSPIFYPNPEDMPEIDYYTSGDCRTHIVSGWSHEQAVSLLNELSYIFKPGYKSTEFILPSKK